MNSQTSLICLGEIVAAQGLKGGVRVKTFTQNPSDLTAYGPLITDSGSILTLKVTHVKSNSLVIASVGGCVDRKGAESLVATKLYVTRDQLPFSGDDEFYYHDLIDKRVLDEENQWVGTVRTVENYGAGDFLEIIDDQQKVYTLPFNKEAVPLVDKEAGVIHINKSFLLF